MRRERIGKRAEARHLNQSRRDYLLLTASKPLNDPLECQNGEATKGRGLLRFQSERKYALIDRPCGLRVFADSALGEDHRS